MAFDRFFAVVYPFRSSIWFRKPKIITPLVWVSSIALMSIAPVSFKSENGVCFFINDTILSHLAFWSFNLVIDYLLPLAIISSLYIVVAGKLWLHEMPADDEVPVHQRQSGNRFSLFSLAFVVVAVVVVFAFPKQARHFEFQSYGGA